MFEKHKAKKTNAIYESVVRANKAKGSYRKAREDRTLKPKEGEFDGVQD